MRKLPVIALALGLLGARSLLGNPLESTLLKEETKKEFDITGSIDNKSFSLDSFLSLGNDWRVNFASDMEYNNGEGRPARINNLDLAVGNKHFYIGASYGDLSQDTFLENSDIMKIQAGLMPLDWLDFSLTGARVNLPNFQTTNKSITSTQYTYNIPMELYALGLNVNIGREFDQEKLKLFPWLSLAGSVYSENPQNTTDYNKLIENSIYPPETISYPFNHLNIQAGLDVKMDFIDLSYKGEFDGLFQFNFANTLGLSLHDKERKIELDYYTSLITKPQILDSETTAPTRNELKFDMNGFALLPYDFFVKGQVSSLVDFMTPTQTNFIVTLGKKFNGWNIEAYYNSKNNVFGILSSTQLDRSTEKESKLRNNFYNIGKPADYDLTTADSANQDLTSLHGAFGNTLEQAVTNIHSRQDLSRLLSYIPWSEHNGTFSAREEYEQRGYGVCRDTNGNLIPYFEKTVFGNEAFGVSIRGAFLAHEVTIVKDKATGKYNLWDYQSYYNLNADSPEIAVQKVYPGAWMYGDGTVSSTVSTVRNAVERQLYDWRKILVDNKKF